MNKPKPEFHLQRVSDNGNGHKAQILKIGNHRADLPLSRRGFLGTGISLGAALGLLGPFRAKADPLPIVYAHANIVTQLAITPDGQLVATGGGDAKVKLWSLPNGQLLNTLPLSGEACGLAITPTGSLLVSAAYDGGIRLWSLPGGQLLRTLTGHNSEVTGLIITPDGRLLASSSYDHSVKLWSLPNGDFLTTLTHPNPVYALAVTPDGKVLASGDAYAGTVSLWSLPDGHLLRTLTGHSSVAYSLVVTPDARLLASGSGDTTIKLWSLLPTGFVRITQTNGHSNLLTLSWEGSGTLEQADSAIGPWAPASNQTHPQTFPVAGDKRFFRVRDESPVPEGTLLQTMTRHTAYVRGLAVTPDGKLLISCAQDNTAIVWDLPSGTLRTFLFDPAANTGDAVTYQVIDPVTGQPLVYTLPCGSAILPSATCVCNCVKGTGGGGGGCTFIICVCLAI